VITLTSHVATVPSYAVPMMALVGLGVGIDYALLVFSRFRTEVLDGSDHATATARALDTAGRSVPVRRLHGDHRPAGAAGAGSRRACRVWPCRWR
jgi:uncharacterized membrane protein YdfJ with MMPL/SSD domain